MDWINKIHNWKSLESLKWNVEDINQFFENINLEEKLTNCTINCFNAVSFRKPQMMEFLTRHQNNKHMTLNPYPHTTDLNEICFLVVKKLKSLKTLL